MAASQGDGSAAIGIDLGTTYSCAAVWRGNHADIIANDLGKRLTPSYVAFTGAGRLVGEAAVNQAALNPTNTIYGKNTCNLFTELFDHPLALNVIFVGRHELAWVRPPVLLLSDQYSVVVA